MSVRRLLSFRSAPVLGAVLLGLTATMVGPALAAPDEPAAQAPVDAKAEDRVESRPDKFAASLAARSQDSRVEVANLRTETTAVYALPDGSFTSEVFASPQWVEQSDGTWADVDLTLRANKSGDVVPAMAPVPLVFAGAGGQAGVWQELASYGTAAAGAGTVLWWRGVLPAPRITGTIATYQDVADGVDLQVEATRTGFTSV